MVCRIFRLIAVSGALPVALAVTLLAPLPAAAESSAGAQSGASLNFRVVIPPVVHVTANDHPSMLPTLANSADKRQASQRLAFTTNLRRGMCMDLQLADDAVAHWHVQADADSRATLSPAPGGWRVCVSRPGQHAVTLQHTFTLRQTAPASVATTHAWPVQLQLAAI